MRPRRCEGCWAAEAAGWGGGLRPERSSLPSVSPAAGWALADKRQRARSGLGWPSAFAAGAGLPENLRPLDGSSRGSLRRGRRSKRTRSLPFWTCFGKGTEINCLQRSCVTPGVLTQYFGANQFCKLRTQKGRVCA